jgi:FtsH-binding integral membrane protein
MRYLRRVRLASLTALLMAAIPLLTPAIAAAQRVTPPTTPGLRNAPAPWVGFAIMFVLLIIVIAVSLMPSKRGHQD